MYRGKIEKTISKNLIKNIGYLSNINRYKELFIWYN